MNRKNRWTNRAGFTLVELAIVLIISGLLTLILFDALKLQSDSQHRIATLQSIGTVEAAMSEYLGFTGHYPCPADPTLGPSDPLYGVQYCGPFPSATGWPQPITNNVIEGGNKNTPDTVLVGAVPFKTMETYFNAQATAGVNISLDIHAADSIDGWGRKLAYAVTGSMVAGTINDKNGAIDVVDENGDSIVIPKQSAHVVIFSYGDDGRGGFNADGGTQIGPDCSGAVVTAPPSTPATALYEYQNCHLGEGKFLSGLRNLSEFSYNDDILKFISTQSGELWKMTGQDPITKKYTIRNTNTGFVGVATDKPSAPLDINGGLYVNGGAVQTDTICDGNGQNCFDPKYLAGAEPKMDASNATTCAAANGQVAFISGIKKDDNVPNGLQVTCGYIDPTKIPNAHCGTGEFVSGLQLDGTLNCCDSAGKNCHIVTSGP